jgi:hypothetical protein
VKNCVALEHLNTYDRHDHGRYLVARNAMPLGEDHWNAKLTWAKVDVIRASPEPHSALAERFGVSTGTIKAVRRGDRWPERGHP